jgi:hypothetical protein
MAGVISFRGTLGAGGNVGDRHFRALHPTTLRVRHRSGKSCRVDLRHSYPGATQHQYAQHRRQ